MGEIKQAEHLGSNMAAIVPAPQTEQGVRADGCAGRWPGWRPGISGLVSIPEPFIGSAERSRQLVANWHQCLAET